MFQAYAPQMPVPSKKMVFTQHQNTASLDTKQVK